MWKNDRLDRVQLELLQKNIIVIGGDIDAETAIYVREALLRLTATGSPEIKILITSDGGSVDIGLHIYDILKWYTGKKTGIVQGYARSMAAVILQACEKREAFLHSDILIHHIYRRQISLDILRDSEKLNTTKEEMEASQLRIYKILSDRTGKSVGEIQEACAKNEDMNAEEAQDFGLIDQISLSPNPI